MIDLESSFRTTGIRKALAEAAVARPGEGGAGGGRGGEEQRRVGPRRRHGGARGSDEGEGRGIPSAPEIRRGRGNGDETRGRWRARR